MARKSWFREGESNPHSTFGPADSKPAASQSKQFKTMMLMFETTVNTCKKLCKFPENLQTAEDNLLFRSCACLKPTGSECVELRVSICIIRRQLSPVRCVRR